MSVLVFVGSSDTDDAVHLASQFDRSLFFEPQEEVAQSLRDKLAGYRNATVYTAACGQADGEAWLNVINRNGLSSSLGTCTDDAKQRFSRFNLDVTERRLIPVVHLGMFLDKSGIDHVDLLVVDAQGMDLAVLKTLDHWLRAGRIGAICTEADAAGFRHYDGVPDNSLTEQIAYLQQFGFHPYLPPGFVAFHPNVIWERGCADCVVEELEELRDGVQISACCSGQRCHGPAH